MQEMRLIDAYALDKEVSGRCAYNFDVDIARALIANAPSVPAVPLEVHERMKRELNNEIICLKAEIEDLKIIKQNALEIISTGQKQMLEIRNNSIKEFAERLKKLFDVLECQYFDEDITMNTIRETVDNLVKEMVGGVE